MKTNIGAVYIHIPFCSHICSYCDFSKFLYNEKWVNDYLESLKLEIENKYNNDIIKTLYIGGGTPSSLTVQELKKLLDITNLFIKDKDIEFTIEVNIENIDEEKLILFKQYGVNRISVGVQTFNEKYLKYLNRYHNKEDIFHKIDIIKKYFNNINVDLMYGFNNQTIEELNEDIDNFLLLDIPHISTYSLIIEKNTILGNNNTKYINEDIDNKMYYYIHDKLKEYTHYEISNYAKDNLYSKHNLTYWNNEQYYGFGIGASGYIDNVRYDNTRGYSSYINGNTIINEELLSINSTMEYHMILGLRLFNGVSIEEFIKKYNKSIFEVFNIDKLIEKGQLIIENGYIKIAFEYMYLQNSILLNFLIDN